MFAHRRLTDAELSPTANKICSPQTPAALQLMAARGMAPLPPSDLLVVLYQFWVVNEPPLAEEAAKTLPTLPNAILIGALTDSNLPAGVLDFLARKLPRNIEVLEGLIRHPQVQDETLASLARLCPEAVCDQIADNQTRWLRCPAIVESLYQNPNCRMSVVHRVLELAVREGLEVKLPNIDEIRTALGDGAVPVDPERDALFREATGEQMTQEQAQRLEAYEQSHADEELDYDGAAMESSLPDDVESLLAPGADEELSLPVDEGEPEPSHEVTDISAALEDVPKGDRVTVISRLRPMEKIRLALLGSAFERAILIRDSNKAVSLSAIKSPRVKENEAVAYAANRTLNPEVIRYIARRREWTKLYQVKLNLVLNPKTPMSAAMGFLGHLQAHDIRKVARSRNIPSALAQAAKRKGDQRR